jgi:UDP-N-acetylglucosamine/UDP-N-acetylgalactosamine diphosphorylase
MPALDLATGQVLLEAPGKLFLSPNGHGGTLTALSDSGLLARLKAQGIEQIFYFQVDNPLVQILDPGFLGMHVQHQAEVSSKVVFKEKPEEKVGVLAQIDGHCGIIEYSDMPKEMTEERLPDGTLTFRAGNPAIHLFHVPFLERVSSGADRLKYHMARKKVPFYDPACGDSVTPVTENALKFELFIFDALPMADRWLAVETLREEEFAPLKNASGADSLETCQALQIARAQRWLRSAGVTVADSVSVELAPTFALDPSDLVGRFPEGTTLTSPRYIR